MSERIEEDIELDGRSGNLKSVKLPSSSQYSSVSDHNRGYWQGGISDRLRVARKTPQAVIKITSHNKGKRAVKRRLDYISREGELMIETETGERLQGKEEINALLEEWAEDFSSRANGRDSTSIVLSFPKGTDTQKAYVIAQEFLQDQYGHNWRYAFAGHKDTDHYHVHAVIKAVGMNGRALPVKKANLREWREHMAEKARENGLELDASPRFARGLSDKASLSYFKTQRIDPWVKGARVKAKDFGNIGTVIEADKVQDLYQVEFINPQTKNRVVKSFKSSDIQPIHIPKDVIKQARQEARVKKSTLESVKNLILETNKTERVAYAREALRLAKKLPDIEHDKTVLKCLDAISDLTRYAKSMPVPLEKNKNPEYQEKPGGEKVKRILEAVRDYVSLSAQKHRGKGRDIEI
jgi:hypothetical protein